MGGNPASLHFRVIIGVWEEGRTVASLLATSWVSVTAPVEFSFRRKAGV